MSFLVVIRESRMSRIFRNVFPSPDVLKKHPVPGGNGRTPGEPRKALK